MTADLRSQLAMLPDDWDSWLVYADQLIQKGDECGEWLVREHRGERDAVAALVDDKIVACSEWLGYAILDTWWWIRKVGRLAEPPMPPDLRRVLAQPVSQLATFIHWDASSDPVPPAIELHRQRVFAALLAWLDRAFTEVPGLGRWQELPDDKLAKARSLGELDAAAHLYLIPATLRYVLQAKARREPSSETPSSIRLNAWTFLVPDSGVMRAAQQQRLSALDRDQRAVIHAASVALETTDKPYWTAVWEAEREAPRVDWFELFAP